MNHAIAERLRRTHGLTVTVQPLDGALRRYDPAARMLVLSETLPRESRGFHMAFQLAEVSKLCKDIDERVHAFLDGPLVGEWPYLWLDATYLKQREGGRIVSVAAIIAMAVNTDGKREIVGLHIGPSEAETFWSGFLKSLARRGLRGVKLVISDAHEGLKAAIRRVFSATWQRCRVHWMRNALSYVSKTQQSMVAAALRQTFIQPDRTQASQTLRHVADQLRQKWPKLASF